jgi:hypothetical protein
MTGSCARDYFHRRERVFFRLYYTTRPIMTFPRSPSFMRYYYLNALRYRHCLQLQAIPLWFRAQNRHQKAHSLHDTTTWEICSPSFTNDGARDSTEMLVIHDTDFKNSKLFVLYNYQCLDLMNAGSWWRRLGGLQPYKRHITAGSDVLSKRLDMGIALGKEQDNWRGSVIPCFMILASLQWMNSIQTLFKSFVGGPKPILEH